MAVDAKKMKKKRDEANTRGEFIQLAEGDTKVYVHPPCRGDKDEWEPTTGLPYITVGVHYSVGKNNLMAVCLDAERNEIIDHPFVKEVLKNRKDKKIKISKKIGCPVCNAIANEEMDDEAAGESRYQERHLWGMTPVALLTAHDDDWRWLENLKPSVLFSGQTIHNELLDAFVDNGGDITDPAAAVLVNINRKGTKKFNTKYKAKTDNETARKPWKASKALKRALIDFMKPGQGEGDLFRIVANMIKGTDELVAALKGVKIEEEDDDEAAPEENKPTCFGQDFEAEDEDDCGKCDFRAECAKACGEEVDEDDSDDEEDDLPGDLGQNGKGPKPKRDVDEDDDDEPEEDDDEPEEDDDEDASTDSDDDEDDAEDDDAEDDDAEDDDAEDEEDPEVIALQLKLAKAKAAKAKKAKAGKSGKKGKAAKKPEPEPEDDDEDDDPPPKSKKTGGKKGKAAKKPAEDDEDDDDLDKLDAELQRLSKGKK